MTYLEKSKWTLEVPCTNEKLHLSDEKIVNGNFKVRRDIIGDFYFNSQGGIYSNLFFKPNKNYDKSFLLKAPLKVYLELTEKCNLKCKNCYIPNKKNKDFDMDRLESLIEEMSSMEVLGIQILGGEPTLFKNLPEVCKKAKSKGLKVEIVSNGYDVPLKLLEKLKLNTDLFAVSLDGNENNHNSLRGNKSSYEHALNTLNKLSLLEMPAEVSMTINKKNYGNIHSIYKLCKEKNIKLHTKMMLYSKKNNDFLLSKVEIDSIKSIYDTLNMPTKPSKLGFKGDGKYSFFGCPGGKFDVVIDAEGKVFRCLYNRESKNFLGDIFKENLSKIWNDNNITISQNLSEKCRSCDTKSRCGGLCDSTFL